MGELSLGMIWDMRRRKLSWVGVAAVYGAALALLAALIAAESDASARTKLIDALVAVIGIGILVWKLVSARQRPPARQV